MALRECLRMQGPDDSRDRIFKLLSRWYKGINILRDVFRNYILLKKKSYINFNKNHPLLLLIVKN